jgi:DNA-binding CsgD family transcriptional regulator
MSMNALRLAAGKALRVAIVSTESSRRMELSRKLDGSGHVIVTEMNDADVILSDGDASTTDSAIATPVVVIGAVASDRNSSLPTTASAEQIDAAIRAAAVGLIVRVARDRSNGFGELRQRGEMRQGKVRSLLTPREVEMLTAIGSGSSNKAIARQLDISLHTVKFHIESLFRKLGARSRAEAVAKGLERTRTETVEL